MIFIVNMLELCISFSVALLLASLGEMFNQRAGVFNLGCEGIMAMGAFSGMLVVYFAEKAGLFFINLHLSPFSPPGVLVC